MMALQAIFVVLSLPLILGAPLNQTVTVGYYAESLCPDCLAFSTKHMDEAVAKVMMIPTYHHFIQIVFFFLFFPLCLRLEVFLPLNISRGAMQN